MPADAQAIDLNLAFVPPAAMGLEHAEESGRRRRPCPGRHPGTSAVKECSPGLSGYRDEPLDRLRGLRALDVHSGDSPVTVIVSASAPTRISALTVATNGPQFHTLTPDGDEAGSTNERIGAGRRSTMRYWPVPSVATVRTFSMSTGLDASTVTPGRTAPETSFQRL